MKASGFEDIANSILSHPVSLAEIRLSAAHPYRHIFQSLLGMKIGYNYHLITAWTRSMRSVVCGRLGHTRLAVYDFDQDARNLTNDDLGPEYRPALVAPLRVVDETFGQVSQRAVFSLSQLVEEMIRAGQFELAEQLALELIRRLSNLKPGSMQTSVAFAYWQLGQAQMKLSQFSDAVNSLRYALSVIEKMNVHHTW